MTPPRLAGIVVAWLALVFASSFAAAQPAATGTIEGRVFNPTNSEFIERARVTVEGTTLEAAETLVLDYIKSHVPEPRKAPLAGSSVYVDRGFLSRDMPELDAHLHYRLIDVSSIKEIARRWYPRAYFNSPEKKGNHRAFGDIRESIAELRYYRDAVFVPPPGPDTESARAVAAGHVVDHG